MKEHSLIVPLLLLGSFICLAILATEPLGKAEAILVAACAVIMQFLAGKVTQ